VTGQTSGHSRLRPLAPMARLTRRVASLRAASAALVAASFAVAGTLAVAPAGAQSSPEPTTRASLLPLVQPLWSDLTAAQQSVLQPFEPQWNSLPLAEKRAWVALADRFPRMAPDAQRRVERRIVQWAELTPAQRELARANYRLAKELPKDERVAEWQNYRSMTPEQRAVLGAAGTTSNTAAGHAGAPTGLAKEAAQPLPRQPLRPAIVPGAAGVAGVPGVAAGSVASDAPVAATETPAAVAPAVDAPAVDAPAVDAPAVDAPAVEPASALPATVAPYTESAETGASSAGPGASSAGPGTSFAEPDPAHEPPTNAVPAEAAGTPAAAPGQ
jgi:hypothetical protein